MSNTVLLLVYPRLARSAFLASLFVVASLSGCGDDDSTAASDAELATAYCAAVVDIGAFAEPLFVALGDDATLEDELAAERQVLGYIKDNGLNAPDSLPSAIRDDYALFIEGFETKLEPGNPQPTADQQAAEERLLAWEEANCV
jgi:hypothetical protein